MNLELDAALSTDDRRRIVRPVAEPLGPAGRFAFWICLFGVMAITPFLFTVLTFWGTIFVVSFSAILLAVLRLGIWHPSLERRMDSMIQMQRIPERTTIRIEDEGVRIGFDFSGRTLKWSDVRRCDISPTDVLVARRVQVIVIPARAFASPAEYRQFLEFLKDRVPANAIAEIT